MRYAADRSKFRTKLVRFTTGLIKNGSSEHVRMADSPGGEQSSSAFSYDERSRVVDDASAHDGIDRGEQILVLMVREIELRGPTGSQEFGRRPRAIFDSLYSIRVRGLRCPVTNARES